MYNVTPELAVDRPRGYNRLRAFEILLHKPDMPQRAKRIRVAIPVPLREAFDYRWPDDRPLPKPGTRVRVPFGKRERIGIVIEADGPAPVDDDALRDVAEVLDDSPLITGELMASLGWAARYYHHPIGEVLAQALPGLLRRGTEADTRPEPAWSLATGGRDIDPGTLRARAPRQADALSRLAAAGAGVVEVLPLAISAVLEQTPALRRSQVIQTGPCTLHLRLEKR